ncbi:MAG TPA: MFS transporter [Ktedonobacterales bacterium]
MESFEPGDALTRHDPFAALRYANFRRLIVGRFLTTLGVLMLGVAVGWELYERTHSAFALGLVGLVQAVPVFALSLPAGHLADRRTRRPIVVVAQLVYVLATLGLALVSSLHGPLVIFYACLALLGVSDAFAVPAGSTLMPLTVPERAFTNAATWSSSSWQLAAVMGPALGGVIIAVTKHATPVYLFNAITASVAILLTISLRITETIIPHDTTTLHALAEGARFLRDKPVMLAAITLDMFAVLFGGATTLLPIYASDILHVGPAGLGWLRAAPSAGAVLMALTQAFRPPWRRAGRTLLLAVAGFGVATVIFGLSRNFFLSLLMLIALGALDNISVVIRATLLMVQTPDAMRGRVNAVNGMFVTASNELGGFESGLLAQLFTPIASVVGGGIGTLLVVGAVALIWPEMRHLRGLSGKSDLVAE